MVSYNHEEIDKKWQRKWKEDDVYKVEENFSKPKYYVLDMFPYPSGSGLHVGHPKGYIATDIVSRFKKLQGFNVLHPMGWDAFGLPAENYAIKNQIHPKKAVEENIHNFKNQLRKIGFDYDWSREINTTNPKYYKWTQWIFLQLYKQGLAYQSHEPILWCPKCKTGLAQEDLEHGLCERCDSEVERKPIRQWVLKITDYAERLLQDLQELKNWPEPIKEMQKNWIGKSEGGEIVFKIQQTQKDLIVFTTRPDTIFGATYMVLAPEHKLIEEHKDKIENLDEVEKYIEEAKKKTDLQRTDLNKEKTGVKIEGLTALNPVTKEELPIFIADYVLINYGTGSIMCVPAHDNRDFEFAKKYNLPIKQVIQGENENKDEPYTSEGVLINSDFLNSLTTLEASNKIIEYLEKNELGQRKINYKLNDWVFSRQRYWGEPIPMIHCEKCGTVPVPEKDLPVKLPEVENYEPTDTGESPLATIESWIKTTCPVCGEEARRETNTMPQWAGSCWYYLRYLDPNNDEKLVAKEKEEYWSPVDCYVGGAEHATRHLIYARFWHKFLFDQDIVSYKEPFTELHNVGLVMAEDGRKMSKRWGNVINPNDVVEEQGADALRVYEMFMAPFNQLCAWSTKGLIGCRKFLDKVYSLKDNLTEEQKDNKALLHQTIKKVGEDIEAFKFNTAISQMMILVNEALKTSLEQTDYEKFLIVLAPFAPHLTEEIWESLGHKQSIFLNSWPEYDENLIIEDTVNLVVQVNGKVRANLEVERDLEEEKVKELVLEDEKLQLWIKDKEIKKFIYIPNKIVNLVV